MLQKACRLCYQAACYVCGFSNVFRVKEEEDKEDLKARVFIKKTVRGCNDVHFISNVKKLKSRNKRNVFPRLL